MALTMAAVLSATACASGAVRYGAPIPSPSAVRVATVSAAPTGSLACLPADDESALAASTRAVMIRQFTYRPDTETIPVGTTVNWTNLDLVAHTVTSDNGVFDSGLLQNRGTCAITFTTPGTFAYHCTVHPAMVATIKVTG